MKKYLLTIFLSILVTGCSSNKYGYSLEEWNRLTQQQRDEIKIEAEDNVNKMEEGQYEKEFVNKPVNKIFGTRSNVY